MAHDILIHEMTQERVAQFKNQMAVELFTFSVLDAKDLATIMTIEIYPRRDRKNLNNYIIIFIEPIFSLYLHSCNKHISLYMICLYN